MLKHLSLKFQLRLIPALACIGVVALGMSLAQWQTRRAVEKEQIASSLQAKSHLPALTSIPADAADDALEYRRVVLSGEFLSQWAFYLDNRPLHGVAGFEVVMPFKLADSGRIVLIKRGWQPRNPIQRTRLPELKTPQGTISIEGVIKNGFDHIMQLGQEPAIKNGVILQNINLLKVREQTGLNLSEYVVEQTSNIGDHLQRDWSAASSGADRHRGYAFQWYALSLMAIIFFVVTGIKRGKNRDN